MGLRIPIAAYAIGMYFIAGILIGQLRKRPNVVSNEVKVCSPTKYVVNC
jgi:hypothetical protein